MASGIEVGTMTRHKGGYVPSGDSDGIWTPTPRQLPQRHRLREAFRGLGSLIAYVAIMTVITVVALVMLWKVSS